ncbi:MAG: DeoR/GlpR family DNA-binding transcription regulator [Marinomonas sp.]|uniref:DeoR/GlpR family transcriptional regulator n=1 Tax=Marinomonas pontica TaxID=264739 RepID=A0ABN6WLP5_9GAMM|nr:DeoR/GlpR family DNA-binding transcription regulator [Marinomonas pontica]MCW8355687.1 DeoR/GlpR family DNA-binding transcription regulator [Marinomonas pontica]BDX01618.1 DeoR/GlpR family transcriptional regulator [Marinomonas pontica]
MGLNERQNQILNWVQQEDALLVEDMVTRFNVSSQTIRKDINQLAERHLVRRTHGGIAPVSSTENLPFDHRQFLNSDAKEAIAKLVANVIPDGASVFLGIGTTVEYVAKALVSHRNLQVFTNNLTVASILGNYPQVRVRVLAGKLRHKHHDLVGEETLSGLRQYFFDYGVLGCGGLDEAQGVLDFDPEEASVSRVLVEQSRHSLLVADQHKWGRKAMARVHSFDSIDWLFSDELTESQTRLLTDHGVHIQLCS